MRENVGKSQWAHWERHGKEAIKVSEDGIRNQGRGGDYESLQRGEKVRMPTVRIWD